MGAFQLHEKASVRAPGPAKLHFQQTALWLRAKLSPRGIVGIGSVGGTVANWGAFLDGEAFNPVATECVSNALPAACEALGLKEKEDAAARYVAMHP
jgi:hypothetical protein